MKKNGFMLFEEEQQIQILEIIHSSIKYPCAGTFLGPKRKKKSSKHRSTDLDAKLAVRSTLKICQAVDIWIPRVSGINKKVTKPSLKYFAF